MFKHVIIGVDERQGGRDAIALGRRLVDPSGETTLVNVHVAAADPWRGTSPAEEAAEHEKSIKLLASLQEQVGVEARVRTIGATSPGRGLHIAAEEDKADLLVVGSSHMGLLGRVLIGDDTRAALDGAPCAVAIAPAGYAREPELMREIGVGYNGSPESEHAVAFARRLAKELGANLSAFEAVAIPTYAFTGGYALVDQETIDDLIDSARERVAALPGVEAHAAYGYPDEELTVYSASLDLLVVGSRSYGPLGRLVHGSTTLKLARTARCPLLVLTRAARVQDTGAQDEATTTPAQPVTRSLP